MDRYDLLIVLAIGFFSAVGVTPFFRNLSHRLGIVAKPGGRRRHQGMIAKLGVGVLGGSFLLSSLFIYWQYPVDNADDLVRLRGLFLGGLVIMGGGLLDDWYDLAAWKQFFFQIIASGIGMYHIVFIEVFTNPLSGEQVWLWRPLALFLTLFWVMGMMNTVNWLDGVDGLAVGVGTIASVLFAWHSYRLGQVELALFPLALAGILIGFLIFNFPPASIFLGSGASLLGYLLAIFAILAPAKIATALLVLAIPILDVGWQIADRLYRGKNPWHGDRGHLHFRLLDRGWAAHSIVLSYYAIAILFGLVAIFASGIVKFGLLVTIGLLTICFLLLYWTKKTPPEGGVPVDD